MSTNETMVIGSILRAAAMFPLVFLVVHSAAVVVRQTRGYTHWQTGEYARDYWLLRTIWHEIAWAILCTVGLSYILWSAR